MLNPQTIRAWLITALTFFLTLGPWALGFAFTDVAAFCLVPLAIVVGYANFSISAPARKCYLQLALRSHSSLRHLFTGRFLVGLRSFCLGLVTSVVVGWSVLGLSHDETLFLCVLLGGGIALSTILTNWIHKHAEQPFDMSFGADISFLVLSLIFIPVLVWANWTLVPHPAWIERVTFTELWEQSSNMVPARRTILVELIAVLESLELLKLWCVVQLGSPMWAKLVFSLDTALAGVVYARAISVVYVFASNAKVIGSGSIEQQRGRAGLHEPDC